MSESFQDVQLISAMDGIGGIQFVQPTYACPAPIFPTLHGVHVKQILKNLEAAKKQVVFLFESHRMESGANGREPSSHVLPQKPTLAFFLKPEAHARIQLIEVNLSRIH